MVANLKRQQKYLPEVVDKDESEIKQIIALIRESALPEDVKKFVIKCIELALWLPLFLQKKNISLSRLRTMIFGKGYNKSDKNKPPKDDNAAANTTLPPNPLDNTEHAGLPETSKNELASLPPLSNLIIAPLEQSTETKPKPGHGRMPHIVYENCTEIQLLLNLTAGSPCPTLCGGKLGDYKAGIIVRIRGQNFAQVYRYFVEKLRCNLCGIIIKADIPPEVGKEKYDESFKAMLALMKYYIAIPFYRQEYFQRMLGLPLPDATQWDLIEKLASYCYPVFNLLKKLAANGTVLQNDDTTLRILEVIKQVKEGTAGERVGMYTTGILSLHEGHSIALFINGRQHSGENVGDILKLRSPDKEPIIQMSDALSTNIPKNMQTILCNCLSHGFRKFEELVDYFPPECLYIMKKLSKVFEYDAQTRDMSPDVRLAHHQKYSAAIMDELALYMKRLIDERLIEPNGELGKAIKYMQKHWAKLTRFLTVAGAPIDNNLVERALKIAIRNRKSALFYRTVYSAGIGGMLTSLIYTCHLAKQNPHHYLIALQKHQFKIMAHPQHWLPWNYQGTMADLKADDATLQAHSPPPDYLAVA